MIAVLLSLALALQAAPADETKAPPDARDKGPDTIDVSSYPPDQQKRYDLFRAKCSKCHPVSRPINSDFDARAWKSYLKRMIRRPNSGINEEQGQEIYQFLVYYASRGGPRGP